MQRRPLDTEKALLEAAPEGVFFVALARQELKAGYLCYYAVAKDPKDPRKQFEWRVAEIDYEDLVRHDVDIRPSLRLWFWKGQPKKFSFGEFPPGWMLAHRWVDEQSAAIGPLEDLLVIAGRKAEFFDKCQVAFEWDAAMMSSVFTLLPHEMRGRIEIAKEMLSESLNAAKTVS